MTSLVFGIMLSILNVKLVCKIRNNRRIAFDLQNLCWAKSRMPHVRIELTAFSLLVVLFGL